jgi:hypothetical protein
MDEGKIPRPPLNYSFEIHSLDFWGEGGKSATRQYGFCFGYWKKGILAKGLFFFDKFGRQNKILP